MGLTIDDDDIWSPHDALESTTIFARKGNADDVSMSDFEIKAVIGRGNHGKVLLVEKLKTKEVYAMKTLRKEDILNQEKLNSTLLEKDILLKVNHPFLVNMSYAFQTSQKLYFVMHFARGGDLYTQLKQQ